MDQRSQEPDGCQIRRDFRQLCQGVSPWTSMKLTSFRIRELREKPNLTFLCGYYTCVFYHLQQAIFSLKFTAKPPLPHLHWSKLSLDWIVVLNAKEEGGDR